MKPNGSDIDDLIKRHLPSASDTEMQSAGERVLAELRGRANQQVPHRSFRWVGAVAAAAAMILTVFIAMKTVRKTVPPLHVMQSGETIRSTDAAGSIVTLADGSVIEMRTGSELTLQKAQDGSLLELKAGSIIVTAAKQHNGHLYVRTKDVTVSVVGTVFLVNAEETGSRVAVIEGEVSVRQGGIEKTLQSGQQVSTSPLMMAQPVVTEIAWSRNAEAHMELLKQSLSPPVVKPLEFAAVAIRPRGEMTSAPGGFACHGIDGVRRSYESAAGPDGVVAPQGRCVGNYLLVSQLISFAYGVPGDAMQSGPAWALREPRSMFQIEAVADDPSTATLDQLTEMVRTMLANQFKLRFHRETTQGSGYALMVAKNGPKRGLTAVADGDQRLPLNKLNEKGEIVTSGRTTMDGLARWLSGFSRGIMPVVNKTDLAGMYEYEVVHRVPGGGVRGNGGGTAPPAPSAMAAPSVEDMRRNLAENLWGPWLEDQLGLRLQEQRNIPLETIVIDQVEKPWAAPAGRPSFEVVSIKRNMSGAIPSAMSLAPVDSPMGCRGTDRGPQSIPLGRCVFRNVTAGFLISIIMIRDNKEYKLDSLPGWVTSEGYDIEAKAEQPATQDELAEMLIGVLVDRFKCTFRTEIREASGFALVAAKGGAKLEKAQSQEPLSPRDEGKSIELLDEALKRPIPTGNLQRGRPVRMVSSATTLTMLAKMISRFWPSPVVNRTNLVGVYKLELRWQPEGPAGIGERTGPDFTTALEEQLGLRLEAGKVPVDFLVIDHIERPTLN